MKLRVATVLSALALSACLASQVPIESLFAQDSSTAKKVEKSGPDGRVPPYFAQIDLTKEQRAKVLEVQNSHIAKIDVLKKQIADLEAKRETDVRAVLTPEQQKKLDELVAAAKKKAAESRSKSKAPEAAKKTEESK